ncbi:MAG: hypothetical protein ACREEM_04875, partial [Blastocatellia bacterium]
GRGTRAATPEGGRMSTPKFEAFLAKIYVDAKARDRFLADPRGEASRAGLAEAEIAALEKIDHVGLELAASSLQRKRSKRFRRIFQK